mgnify:CR=1 FL=1
MKSMLSNKYGIRGSLVRDISWLSFNERVLQEAQDPQNHIADRLKFLGIFSNNIRPMQACRFLICRDW